MGLLEAQILKFWARNSVGLGTVPVRYWTLYIDALRVFNPMKNETNINFI